MSDQAKHDRDGLVPDTALAELVAQRLHLPSPPTIVARKIESIDMSVVR